MIIFRYNFLNVSDACLCKTRCHDRRLDSFVAFHMDVFQVSDILGPKYGSYHFYACFIVCQVKL